MSQFLPIPIVHFLKHELFFVGIEIHVKIAEKFVRLNLAEEPYRDILEKLLKKSVVHVYLTDDDFSLLLNRFTGTLQTEDVSRDELRMSTADTLFTMTREFIARYGISVELVGAVKEADLALQELIKKNDNGLGAFLKKFEKDCSEEFLKIGVVNFLCAAVIARFPWKSQQIIEKTMLAGLFCDITLSMKDFAQVQEYESIGGELSDELKHHPLAASQILCQHLDLIPQETLTIIEQHHEKPDGSGFPYGIDLSRFNQLSAIFIVCQRFTEELFATEFDVTHYHSAIQRVRGEFSGGVFTKALDALIEVIAIDTLRS